MEWRVLLTRAPARLATRKHTIYRPDLFRIDLYWLPRSTFACDGCCCRTLRRSGTVHGEGGRAAHPSRLFRRGCARGWRCLSRFRSLLCFY